MEVTIKFHDDSSFTVEEIVRQAVSNYGKGVKVEVTPESNDPESLIYFGIQRIITHRQLSFLFERGIDYGSELKKLRAETLYTLQGILDRVIIDNESKVD